MNAFAPLLDFAGAWKGTNRVQPTPDDPVNESASALTLTPILRNTFIRIDQDWSWQDEPQSGSMLIGYDGESKVVSMHWVDTWHNGTRVMPLVGEFDGNGALVARGHFSAGPGPDWGWRIEIQLDEDRLKIDMFCVEPESMRDVGWVWSEYRRV